METNGLNASEKLIQGIVQTFAQYQQASMAEMVKEAMKRKAEGGYSSQRPPVGYSTTERRGLFKINRQGQQLRRAMKSLAEEEISLEIFKMEVFYILNSQHRGFRSASDMKKLVSNPYYAGKISYCGNMYKGLHEPLITVAEQDKLIEIFSN